MSGQYNELEALRAEVVLGNDVDAFFRTDPGRYVIALSHETVMGCIEKMKEADSSNNKEIAKIQLELKSADNALQWLQEAIRNGRQAMQQLEIIADEEER